jgi:hypothetical protein
MLDVPAPSSASNSELWFEPFTERIPEVGTEVRLVLTPKNKDAAKPDAKVEEDARVQAEEKPADAKPVEVKAPTPKSE